MILYVEHGDLPLDNNPCENANRQFVIGRKKWLFFDSQVGAHASALILIEIAKVNGQEPPLWLTEAPIKSHYAQTAHLKRNLANRGTLRKQQPGHRSFVKCLSVFSDVNPIEAPYSESYSGDYNSDAGGPRGNVRIIQIKIAIKSD